MKHLIDLTVKSIKHINEKYVLIRLTDTKPLPDMKPGQFVELRIDNSPTTFLRRPISIHFVDKESNELWLLVAVVGDGTRALANLNEGDTLNVLLPLGNGFMLSETGQTAKRVLLTGGGVGVAPLLYAGKMAKEQGKDVTFLLGARSAKDLLELEEFEKYGTVLVTTEDGTLGEKGFVTNHSLLEQHKAMRANGQDGLFDIISVCGPTPMMKAVAAYARSVETECEVSLENMMACGLGACLCCVQDTKDGNVCVCKEGPVFNINKLNW